MFKSALKSVSRSVSTTWGAEVGPQQAAGGGGTVGGPGGNSGSPCRREQGAPPKNEGSACSREEAPRPRPLAPPPAGLSGRASAPPRPQTGSCAGLGRACRRGTPVAGGRRRPRCAPRRRRRVQRGARRAAPARPRPLPGSARGSALAAEPHRRGAELAFLPLFGPARPPTPCPRSG